MRTGQPSAGRGRAPSSTARARASSARTPIVRARTLAAATLSALCAAAALALACALPAGASAAGTCTYELNGETHTVSNQFREEQGSTYLPDCRAFEQVSPVDKQGGDVMPYSLWTRAAADGEAVQFSSLRAFGDVQGTGAAAEYLARRSSGGWASHSIMPVVSNASIKQLAGGGDAFYDWEFSADLSRGVFSSERSITQDANTTDAGNLYLRTGLLTAGGASSQLLTACPGCSAPLPLPGGGPASVQFSLPFVAGASPDMGVVVFESIRNLTSDAPAQSPLCGMGFPPEPLEPPEHGWVVFCNPRLYEWDHGVVRLVGILPDKTPAVASQAATGARDLTLTPNTVSDGSDGHTRIFFTFPTEDGSTPAPTARGGNLYMRVDAQTTVQLNASERTTPDNGYAPAQFLYASKDGERVFFETTQQLTDDAPTNGAMSVYMYDATKPEGENLTMLTQSANAEGILGASDDGHYVYLDVDGALLPGDPTFQTRIYLWHDGQIQGVGQSPVGVALDELLTDGVSYGQTLRQARATPDGKHLLFTSNLLSTGQEASTCSDWEGSDCRMVYVYSADTGQVTCVSCNPSGAAPTSSASVLGTGPSGGARATSHQNHPMADDGSRVFFNTVEALVPEDVNGKMDAYEWRAPGIDGCAGAKGCLSLLSSGKTPSDSFFLEASASGNDVFIATVQPLVGSDVDEAYDLYDVRVGGGFPEPVPPAPPCGAGTCRTATGSPPVFGAPATVSVAGVGNLSATLPVKRSSAAGQRQRLARALRACRRVRSRAKRHRCEVVARRRYGKVSKRGGR